MEATADGVTVALAVVRAIHFAATALVAGTLFVRVTVAEPALRPRADVLGAALRRQYLRLGWISLALAVVTGAIWIALQAAAMSDLPLAEALAPEVLRTVIADTRFGLATAIRAALALAVAGCLLLDRMPAARWLAAAAAVGLVAAIAWTGHAGAEPGAIGRLHLAADVLHLVGAGVWIGGLVPLVMILSLCRRRADTAGAAIAREATMRFSTLGAVSVALLVVTGCINAFILVGTPLALISTVYGHLLLIKLGLFVALLAIAAFNREVLRPKLMAATTADPAQLAAMHRLSRNSLAEIVLGLAIFGVVGALGIMHPAVHMMG